MRSVCRFPVPLILRPRYGTNSVCRSSRSPYWRDRICRSCPAFLYSGHDWPRHIFGIPAHPREARSTYRATVRARECVAVEHVGRERLLPYLGGSRRGARRPGRGTSPRCRRDCSRLWRRLDRAALDLPFVTADGGAFAHVLEGLEKKVAKGEGSSALVGEVRVAIARQPSPMSTSFCTSRLRYNPGTSRTKTI